MRTVAIGWGLALLASGLQASSGAAWMKPPQGARSQALAGSDAALAWGAESLWSNPAGLGGGEGQGDLLLSHSEWLGETQLDYGAASVRLGSRWALGGYGLLFNGSDTARDSQGQDIGTLEARGSVAGAALALRLGETWFGAGIGGLQESYAGRGSSGLTYDWGLQSPFWDGNLRLGLAGLRQGDKLSGNAAGYSPPTNYRAQLALPKLPAGLVFSAGLRLDISPELVETDCGLEWSQRFGGMGLALRAGYTGGRAHDAGLAALSFGGGAAWHGLDLDLAWLPRGELGSSLVGSLRWTFWAAAPAPRGKK